MSGKKARKYFPLINSPCEQSLSALWQISRATVHLHTATTHPPTGCQAPKLNMCINIKPFLAVRRSRCLLRLCCSPSKSAEQKFPTIHYSYSAISVWISFLEHSRIIGSCVINNNNRHLPRVPRQFIGQNVALSGTLADYPNVSLLLLLLLFDLTTAVFNKASNTGNCYGDEESVLFSLKFLLMNRSRSQSNWLNITVWPN